MLFYFATFNMLWIVFIASSLFRKFRKCARESYLSTVVGKSLAISGIFHNFAWCQSQSCHFDAGNSWRHSSLLVPIDDNQAELAAFVNQLILTFWLSISNTEHTSVDLSVIPHKSLSFLQRHSAPKCLILNT